MSLYGYDEVDETELGYLEYDPELDDNHLETEETTD